MPQEATTAISIPYGSEQVTFTIPARNLLGVLERNEVQFPPDEEQEIAWAIDHPVGCGRLAEIIPAGAKIAIISDDISRPTPVYKILPILLNRLHEAGVRDEQIFIVMALGSHRDMTPEEMEQKVGAEICRRYPVYNSRFRDKAHLADLGIAPGGVHVWADKQAMAADVRIGIGSIVPHPAVGWSGGGKIIYPGITGEDTVAAFHLQHGKAGWNMFGSEESPVRRNMEAWVDTVGLHFIVNIVGPPDGRIYKAVAGHYVKAHRAGVRYAKELYGVEFAERPEIAVVSSHPADADFWQATKGILPGDLLVKDGGTVILVSPCPEGIGPHPEYMEYIGDDDVDGLLKKAETGEGGLDLVALPVAATVSRIRKRIHLALVSDGITREEAAKGKFAYFSSLQEAVTAALGRYGAEAKVGVIPLGAEIVPIWKKE
ncbi:MAG TPA: nickel-dependent lactate racemase [Firmicutes bacterium]|nr:nickel-dependent lactate racemase [Bacillota bacterium]